MFNSDSRDSESDMIVVNVKENEVYTDPGWCERSVILILNQGTSFYFTAQGCFIPHISSWTTCSVTDRDMHCLQRTGVVDSGLQWTFQIGNRMGEEKTTDIQYCGIMVVAELLLFVFPAGDSFFFPFLHGLVFKTRHPATSFSFCLSECICVREQDLGFSQTSPPWRTSLLPYSALLSSKNGSTCSAQKQPISDGTVSKRASTRPAIW